MSQTCHLPLAVLRICGYVKTLPPPRTESLPSNSAAATTVPSTIVPCKNRGIYPSDPGIYPMTTGIKLDLCVCTIPTVGFYGKYGEVTTPPSSRNHTMIHMRPPLMTSPPPTCRRLPSPAITRRRRCPPAVALRRKKVSLTHSVGTGAGVTLC